MKKLIYVVLILFSIHIQAQKYYQQPFPGLRPYKGESNEAILEITLAPNNSTKYIQKPLIIVEGFDSGLMGKENPLGEVDYQIFRSTVDPYTASLSNQMNTYDIIYINFMNGRDDMHRNAYLVEDIIKWVNDMKKDTEKLYPGTTKQNVVLGQSMGGLIARYALRDMEKQLAVPGNQDQTWNHQTSLYISHDAPHQGANIPLAIQYLARHAINETVGTPVGDYSVNVPDTGASISVYDILNLMEQPGTKQLMIDCVNSSFTVDNTAGNTWRTELQNLGYPQQTINIAISNGSQCANPQDLVPLGNLYSLNGSAKPSFMTEEIMAICPIIQAACIVAAVADGKSNWLAGALPGTDQFNMDFYGKALPAAGSSGQIYHGAITYTKKLWSIYSWTVNLITPRDYSAPSGLSYDYYPGSKSPFTQIPTSGSASYSNIFVKFGATFESNPNFDFVPTPSALDVGKGQITLIDSDYFAKYNKNNPPGTSGVPPFDNYTTSFNTAGTNEGHISFNTVNGNWLAKELNPELPAVSNCSFMCSDTSDSQISGKGVLCSSESYSVLAGLTTYNWSITNGANLVTLSSNGTNVATLTHVGTSSGYVTLSVYLGNCDCGHTTIPKTIWVGAPVLPLISLPPPYSTPTLQKTEYGQGGWNDTTSESDVTYNYCTFTVPQSIIADQGITAIVWTKNTSNSYCNYGDIDNNKGILKTSNNPGALTTSADVSGYIYNPWGISINISLTNVCLSTTNTTTYYCSDGINTKPLDPNSTGKKANTANIPEESTNTLSIYPNPSKGIFNIDLSTVEGDFDTVKVYDILGALVYEGDLKSKSPNLIDLTSMSTGCYIAKISGNNENASFQLIKQ